VSRLNLPSGWREIPLAPGVSIAHGFAFKSENFEEFGEYAITTPGNFYEEGGFKTIGVRQRYYNGVVPASFVFKSGELIVAMTEQADGLLGSAAVVPNDRKYLHNQRVGRVRCDSSIVQLDFLYWLMNSEAFRASVRETAAGTKVKHTSPLKLLSIPAAIPPLVEQERIAGVLNGVSHLISSLERLIAKKLAIKQGMLQQLLTGKTRLPGFTDDWHELGFDETLATVNTRGSQVDAHEYRPTGKFPVVDQSRSFIAGYTNRHVAPILPGSDGRLVFGDHTCISKFVDFPFVVGADGTKVLRSRRSSELQVRFIAYLLEFEPVEPTGYNRHFSKLRERAFRFPVREEQRAIVEVLTDADAEIDALRHRLTSTRAIKQGMMQELLTGRTRLIPAGEKV